MPDMLVRLYALPPLAPHLDRLRESRIEVRRARPEEARVVTEWVAATFAQRWGDEVAASFALRPPSCHLAVELQGASPLPGSGYDLPAERLVGFACTDVVARAMFGPTGVTEGYRGLGAGTALLLAALHDLHTAGYAYAGIARVGPLDFYRRTVGARVIEGSEPGAYRGKLLTKG
jgi:ribosomal protein S18 acetylase RimI-like enzyme